MAYDERLAERVRELLGARDGLTERKMFGGIAWMIGGNMAVGVLNDDLMVRHDKAETQALLDQHHTRLFEGPGGRPMSGFLLVAPDGTADDEQLARWVDSGAGYASSLEPK